METNELKRPEAPGTLSGTPEPPHKSPGNWERLAAVIEWANMSTNYFARHIGLPRGENLYQIRRGHNGISRDVARRIVGRFPEISEGWLLTGEGHMFSKENLRGAQIPFYRVDVERFVTQLDKIAVDDYIVIPSMDDADLAMIYYGEAMSPRIPVGSVVFLQQTEPAEIIPGEDYVVATGKSVLLRRIRATTEPGCWRLECCDREKFDDLTVATASIGTLYRVRGRLICS